MLWTVPRVNHIAYIDNEFDPFSRIEPERNREGLSEGKLKGLRDFSAQNIAGNCWEGKLKGPVDGRRRRNDVRRKGWGRVSVRDEGFKGLFTACS